MTQPLRFRIIIGVVVAALLLGAWLVLNRPEAEAHQQSTDDAYVQADFTVIAPQIAGVIRRVDVAEHQSVVAGTPLIEIDDRDLRIAMDNAQARIAAAEASLAGLRAQITRQQSAIAQARATVAADDAALRQAQTDRDRFANLARDGSGTVQDQQQSATRWDVQRAARDRDLAALQSAQQQTAILQADLDRGLADLQAAQAGKAEAELNLSYARITAPVGGVVAQRAARTGAYVRVGDPLLTIVPLNALYVEANFRETQLAHVTVGQVVSLSIDGLPGVRLKGRVESLGPASGVSFSPTPAHNATGNFTKIVQRLPVRISLDRGQPYLNRLRVGMSVRPRIDTSH